LEKVKPGKTTQSAEPLGTPLELQSGMDNRDAHRDYLRRNPDMAVQFPAARRKLKIAMAEFYRRLELLKLYALLNRTAFRKINKKFDKTVGCSKGKMYMDKVNNAHSMLSDILDNIINDIEDLYARYFERGNRKIAIRKLRRRVAQEGDFWAPTIRSGILLGTRAVFAVQGVVDAVDRLRYPITPEEATITSYLLQMYGGYFLMWLLVALFCINAAVFSHFRINYAFIFEFDPRHTQNWKQLCKLPVWFGLLMGLTVWCNFSYWSPEAMYIYWPVILVCVSALLLVMLAATHVLLAKQILVPSQQRSPAVCRSLLSRVPRLLPRRHVLLANLRCWKYITVLLLVCSPLA
jgi:xenotropic and polytropic retrovirus receptor 1